MTRGHRLSHDAEGRVYACPECDTAGDIYQREADNAQGDEQYRCGRCSARFDDVAERDRRDGRGTPPTRDEHGLPNNLPEEMKAAVLELRDGGV